MMMILSNIFQFKTVRHRRTETNPGFCSDFAKLYQRNEFKFRHASWSLDVDQTSFFFLENALRVLWSLRFVASLSALRVPFINLHKLQRRTSSCVLLCLVVSVLRSSSEPGGKICMVSLNILKLLYKSNQLTLRGSDGRHRTTPEPLMQVKDGQKMLALRIAFVYHLKVSPVFSSPRPSCWFQ